MKTKLISSTVLGLGLLLAVSAHATTVDFDFAAIADGDNSYGVLSGERGESSFTFIKDGISVTATGFSTANPADSFFAYLDEGKAGLGVCQALNTYGHCNPSSDDNVTFGESLKLIFDQKVTLNKTIFANGRHHANFRGDFNLSIDGGPVTTIALKNIFSTPLSGTEFIFSNPNAGGGSGVSNNQQFYIQSMRVAAVPVPAALWLFGSGLICLTRLTGRGKKIFSR